MNDSGFIVIRREPRWDEDEDVLIEIEIAPDRQAFVDRICDLMTGLASATPVKNLATWQKFSGARGTLRRVTCFTVTFYRPVLNNGFLLTGARI
jgi:hypothetical protein